MTLPRVGSLCTGFGGIEQALTLAGLPHELAFVADNDPAAAKLLATRFPGVGNLGDITTVDWANVEPVDVLTAGFPCQDISLAGRQAGLTSTTRSGNIWAHVVRAAAALWPRLLIIENVRGILSARTHSDVEPCPWCVGDDPDQLALRALGAVLGDLANLGFDAVWTSLPASAVGACHERWRVFVLAWPATDPDRDPVWAQPVRVRARQHPPVAGDLGPRAGLNLLPTPDATHGRRTSRTGPLLAGAVELLPTPTAQDSMSSPARHDNGHLTLRTAASLLPTPGARLGDHRRGTPSEETAADRYAAGRRNLDDAIVLLPTPRATDGDKGGPNQHGSAGDLMLPAAVQPGRWGTYTTAIHRWEQILGRPAPDPTQPAKRRGGAPQLSPRFVEWMQGLPDGWVTSPDLGLSRTDTLRLLGNGVVAQQCAAALPHLLLHLKTQG